MAPDKKIERNNVIYGSLFTSVSWVVLTQLYSVYVENFTNYNTFYGGVSSILILMLWLYLNLQEDLLVQKLHCLMPVDPV